MTLRADHVAGAAFVVFGLLVIALSGDLPFGQLSMPGAGFLPQDRRHPDHRVRRDRWSCARGESAAILRHRLERRQARRAW